MNIDPKLVEQWASEWTTLNTLKRRHYIAQRAAEYGAQQERERLLAESEEPVASVFIVINKHNKREQTTSIFGDVNDGDYLYTEAQLAAARLRGEQDAQAKKPDSHALPIAYIKHRQGKIDWDSDDNCVISNTPGAWPIQRKNSGTILSIGPCVADEYAGHAWLDITEEDARLIAAAPLLLDALKHIQRCIPYGGFAQIHHNSLTYQQLDAAIADAEGVKHG